MSEHLSLGVPLDFSHDPKLRTKLPSKKMEFVKRILQHDNFSIQHAKDLLLPFPLTKKENFLKIMRECNICIATTGLHNSIGWKFGEYIAASRAIVSEPLRYQLPGDFNKGENFLEFTNDSELVNCIRILQEDKEKVFDMMKSNFMYYNNYVQPDKMILNTLLKVYQNE